MLKKTATIGYQDGHEDTVILTARAQCQAEEHAQTNGWGPWRTAKSGSSTTSPTPPHASRARPPSPTGSGSTASSTWWSTRPTTRRTRSWTLRTSRVARQFAGPTQLHPRPPLRRHPVAMARGGQRTRLGHRHTPVDRGNGTSRKGGGQWRGIAPSCPCASRATRTTP